HLQPADELGAAAGDLRIEQPGDQQGAQRMQHRRLHVEIEVADTAGRQPHLASPEGALANDLLEPGAVVLVLVCGHDAAPSAGDEGVPRRIAPPRRFATPSWTDAPIIGPAA